MDEKQLQFLFDNYGKSKGFKDFNEFKSLMQNEGSRKVFFDDSNKDLGFKDYNDFEVTIGVKKKDGGQITSTTTSPTQSPSNPPLQSKEDQIPEISLYATKDGDVIPSNDVVKLSKKAIELQNRKKLSQTGGIGSMAMGTTTSTEVDDEDAKKESEGIRNEIKNQGYDADKLFEQYRDVPESISRMEGFRPEDEELNPQNHSRKLATASWQTNLTKALEDKVNVGELPEEEYNKFKKFISDAQSGGRTYKYKREDTRAIISLIDKNVEDEGLRSRLKKAVAIDRAYSYGQDITMDKDKELAESPESKYLDKDETLAYQYLKDTDPEVAKGYDAVFVDSKKLDDNEKVGWEEKMSRLKTIGVKLQQNAVQEEINSLYKNVIATSPQQELSPEQLKRYNDLIEKKNQLDEESSSIALKYQTPARYEIEDITRELIGNQAIESSKAGGLLYLLGKTGSAFEKTWQGIWDLVSEPFRSDEGSKMNQLAAAGQLTKESSVFGLPQKKTSLQSFEIKVKPELKERLVEITHNKDLSYEDKYKQVYTLLKDNPGAYGKFPISGGKLNVNPTTLFYSVGELAATIAPYIAMEAATGGGATASIGRKILSSFTSAASTMFRDSYATAVKDGSGNPFAHALRTTAISSAFMAGAGTPQIIKKMLGTKTAVGEMVNSMTDDAINAVLKEKNKISKFFGRTVVDSKGNPINAWKPLKDMGKGVLEAAKEGLEGGAKFETVMGGGELINQSLDNKEIDVPQMVKKMIVGTLSFGAFGTVMGSRGQFKKINELESGSLLKASANPEGFISAATEMLKDGEITREKYDQIVENIKLANEVGKKIKYVGNNGKELSEGKKGKLLLLKIEQRKLEEKMNEDFPTLIKEKTEKELEEVKDEVEDLYVTKRGEEELPDTYIINGKPVSEQEFDTAIENAKNTKEKLDVEYNGDDEVRIQKIIDLGGTSQAGTTTITDEAPTTTTEVTKPVQQDAGVPEQQGTKEAVSKSNEPIGHGNAETTTTVLEKGNSVGVGGDVKQNLGIKRGKNGFEGDFLNDYELIGEGSEHTVYRKKGSDKVIRLSEPYSDKSETTFNQRVRDAKLIDEIVGDGSLNVIGYYESENGTKNPIYEQNFQDSKPISEQEVEAHLRSIGGIEYGDKYNRGYLFNHNGKWYKINDYSDNFFKDKNGKIVAIDAAIVPISDVEINKARENDADFNKAVEQSLKETTKAGSVGEVKAELPAQKVKQLRLQEQAEYDAMPNPKDEAERKRIYDKYDKLISPLLDEGEVKAEVPPPSEPTPPNKKEDDGDNLSEKVVKSRVKRIAKSLNVDEQRSQQIHDIALKAKDYEDFKRQVNDLVGDDTVNENRIAEQYDDIREKAKSEYEKELEKNLEDLRAAYTDATLADAALKRMNEQSPKSVRGFIKRLLTGATPESVAANKARLVEMQRQYRKEKSDMRAILPRERGANFVVEKLSRAARNGEISQEAADLAIDLIRKQPDMFGDLAISITGKKGENDGVQGWYRAADALVKIFKNPSDPTTAVHELLHHTERFLPHEIRDKIIGEWNNEVNLQIADIQKKLKTETNTDTRQQLTQGLLYLGLAQERQIEPNSANVKSMERIMSKYLGDHTDSQGNFHKGLGNSWYQLYNPSEWWAVNASRLFKEAKNKPELKTWTDKAKAFYNYLIESVKRIFKGSPTAAVEKALKAVLNGDVLEDREGTQLSASQKLLNIKQKGSFEDKLKSIYDEVNENKKENEAEAPPPKPPVDKTKESEIKIVEDIEEQDLSGIRKKLVSDEIIKGVDLDRISDKEMMGLGRKILDSGEVKPEAIVTKIITEGKGVLTPTEVVALITYKRDIDNQLSDVYKKINEKKSAKEDIGTLGVEAKSLERQINDFDVMAVITAQQQSMAFRLRQRMLDRDYNVVTQIEKYKSVNNGEIPEEVESKLRELDKQLKEVKEKLVEAEKKIQEKEAQDAVNNIKESVDREKSYTDEELNKKIEEEVESEISKLYEELPEQKRSAADKAIKALEKFRVKLKSRAYESTLGIPIALADLGAVTAIRAIKIGKTVSEAVEIGINRIKKSLKEKGIDKWDQESEYRKDLSDTLEAEGVSTKNKIKDKPVINKDGTVTIPNDMLRDLVKRGVTDINDLVDEVHSKLVQELPEITKRQVRDYITGYGKTVNPTSDKLQTQINTAKRVGRLLSELEDLKKMGEVEFLAKYQKTKPSKNKILERERELKRQIKSLSKDIADIDNTKTDEERLILTKESVTRRIDELKRKIKNKDFSKNKKNQSVTDSELVELNKQKEKIQAEFDDLQYQNELKNRGTWQKVEDAAYEATSGLLRGLTLSLDMSAGLVQGMRKLFTNPGKSVKAFVESIKHLVSEKYSEDYLAKHKAQSYFPLIKASKLAIDDKSGKVSVKEGMFISNWINLVWDKLVSPVIGFGTKKGTSLVRKINPYLASQRAYDGYVNSIRIQSFLQIAKQIENDGYTFESNPEVFKKAADFVNTTTGRGSLGQADANSKWLNIFLTAPRKVISELKLYTPYALVYYSRMPKAVRKKAFLDFAKFATSFITTNALIWAATKNWDDEEEDKKDNFWNPNSSDFLTHKIGDNRISVAGGMKSIINFQSRFITGEFTDQYGKTTKLGERFGKDINTRFDLLTRFITGKSAPAFNVALKKLDERKGKEMSNEEIIKSLTVPLWMQDIKELYKDDPATVGAFLTAMSILGANVRSVEKSKSDIDKEELSKNPKLKYFIDKGYNFPEMNPEKIQTKEINNKVVERLSQYDDKTQKLYIETKKKHLADELEKLKNGHKIIYVDNEGGVSLTSSYNNKPKQFKDATKEQVQYIIINIIGSAISKKLKKDILEKKKPISKIKN